MERRALISGIPLGSSRARCLFVAVAAAAVLTIGGPLARADLLADPAVFASANGVLDILMIAKPQAVPNILFQPPDGTAGINPIGWVYEICPRPASGNECPPATTTVADYGGVRLALRAGDALKIRLVNRLPAVDKAKLKHAAEPGQGNLPRNPTNLHTHGLIVPARAPTATDPTFGDYVFVDVYNSANGAPEAQPHQHGMVRMDVVDYRIDIPGDHPSGLFWFHPHVHGLSLNQLSSGLSGILTVGDVRDYVDTAPSTVRHLILKDMQVLAAGTYQVEGQPVTAVNGEVQHQQVADFCEQRDTGGPGSRLGFCEGEPDEHGTGNSFIGSRWYFTINGQIFPTIRMTSPEGEIWRLTNASGQFSYRLNLIDDISRQHIPMQLVAVDGVSIDVKAATPANTLVAVGGNKFTVVDCAPGDASPFVCVRDLVMMPSSRAEVWVTYRDANGTPSAPPSAATATLRQDLINLGPAGESWPEFKLAKVEFAHPAPDKTTVSIASNASAMLSASAPSTPQVANAAEAVSQCKPLAQGHRRRIFFGVENPTDSATAFGLGYEEVNENGAPVSGTQIPVSAFDPARTVVCVPLGSGGAPVREIWELVNLATEIHNFHIHQTKFRVLDATALPQVPMAGPSVPVTGPSVPVILEDNVPVPFAIANVPDIEDSQNGYCTIAQWRSGQCSARPIVLEIPFSQAGEFVYHCHILEHEDGGMMAKIRVRADAM